MAESSPEISLQRAHTRRTADFHPSVWGDYFVKHVGDDDRQIPITYGEESKILKEEVRRALIDENKKASQKLKIIDAIQRLCITYHFESEIQEILDQVYKDIDKINDDCDLYSVSLRFRLLRQHGYKVSTDMFNKFKDGEGKLKEELIHDVKGILSLYEASHLITHEDDILDEALIFTKTRLEPLVTQLESLLANKVKHVLRWPLRKHLPKVQAWYYFSLYQAEENHNQALLKLAKLEYNTMQEIYQKELKDITKWWMRYDFSTKLPFVRDRVIEDSIWGMPVCYEPHLGFARKILTKFAAVVSVIDDIFDVHGTIQELELFASVVDRWDEEMKADIPDYMKLSLTSMFELYAEVDQVTRKEGRPFCGLYLKEALKQQVKSYLIEARWFNSGYVPSLEEYLSVAKISAGYPLHYTTTLCGIGQLASRDVFEWVRSMPKIIDTTCVHIRLMDDIKSHEFEQERGHVASAVECYMKEHGATKQEAYDYLNNLTVNLWKDINEGLLRPFQVPMAILNCALNFVRISELVYKDGDGYTNSKNLMKEIVASLYVNPTPV